MDVLKRICALFAAFASMLSGGFWYSSAQLQFKAGQMPATTVPELVKKMPAIAKISAQHNLWAAELAAVAGIFLAIALLLE